MSRELIAGYLPSRLWRQMLADSFFAAFMLVFAALSLGSGNAFFVFFGLVCGCLGGLVALNIFHTLTGPTRARDIVRFTAESLYDRRILARPVPLSAVTGITLFGEGQEAFLGVEVTEPGRYLKGFYGLKALGLRANRGLGYAPINIFLKPLAIDPEEVVAFLEAVWGPVGRADPDPPHLKARRGAKKDEGLEVEFRTRGRKTREDEETDREANTADGESGGGGDSGGD